jgi:cyclopropane fatty-acyl-phospholipid synthase-like methyltransferase
MSTIDYYNENAERYFRETFDADLTGIYPLFLEHLPKDAHILDAGCGSGRDSLYFIKQDYRVTAIDASEELSRLASEAIGQKVLPFSFEEMHYRNEFDGIWACASLVHIPRSKIDRVFRNFSEAMRSGGMMYVSFKHGDREVEQNGRFFSFYDEERLTETLKRHPGLEPLKMWLSGDVRPDRRDEMWLNAVIQKRSSD